MHRRYEHFLLLFYNAIAQAEAERFEDIPDEARQILSYMDYHDIVAPLVSRYIDEGGTCMEASNKFGVTEGFARQRGREVGRFKRYRK